MRRANGWLETLQSPQSVNIRLSLGAITALQLTLGLLIQIIVLRIVGTGAETDAYVAAQAVPLVLASILAACLQNVWQPRLAVLLTDRDRWRDLLGIAQGQGLIALAGPSLVLALTATLWIPALFPGFAVAQSLLAIRLAPIFFAAMALNGQSALLTTALRAQDRFIDAEVTSLAGTAAALCAIALAVPTGGVESAAAITLARAAIVFAVLYWRTDRPALRIRDAASYTNTWKELKPLLAGSSIYKTAPLIDRYWSSNAAVGGVTILGFAQTAMGAVAIILERALCMPVTPGLARLAERGKFHEVRLAYRRSVLHVTIATVLAGAVLVSLIPAWAELVYTLIRIPAPLAENLWLLCFLLLGYLHASAAGTVVVSAFYAMGDTRTPLLVGLLGFIFGVLLKSAGFLWLGLPGLAIGTSAYYLCNLFVLCSLLEKKLDGHLS